MSTDPRSYLFVPGNRPERFEKARAAGADAVILDLEDAVPPEAKVSARVAVSGALDASHPVFVRINSAETEWFADDLAALNAHPGVAGILLPKAESADQIAVVAKAGRDGLEILPIVETARGFSKLAEICAVSGVGRIVFGTLDFQIDLGMDADDVDLLPFRCGIVLASRLAGIAPPVDGVSTTIDDADAIEADARRGRRLGFGAKLCIHPKQIAAVHRAYCWSEAERAWAARVIAAVEQSAGSAVAVDGKMVDAPVIAKARRIAKSSR
jgi:citrate lyase subunit beta / citryl-CoA lyase